MQGMQGPSRRDMLGLLGVVATPVVLLGLPSAPSSGREGMDSGLVARWVEEEVSSEVSNYYLVIGQNCNLLHFGVLGSLSTGILLRAAPVSHPATWTFRMGGWCHEITAVDPWQAKQQAQQQAVLWLRQALAQLESFIFSD